MIVFIELLHLLRLLLLKLQPWLIPLCFVLAWGITFMVIRVVWVATHDTIARARKMHEIPCADCCYYTGDYRLKCPVHPHRALSEQAIGCPDFRSRQT